MPFSSPKRWLPFLLALLLAACSSPGAEPLSYVDLSLREPLPAAAAAEITPLRMAVAAVISPQGTVESYADLADYLSRKLDRPVELVQRRTYAGVNDLIASHQVDLAFVCTSAYVEGREQFGMKLLVVPEIEGQRVYHSDLIVAAGSPARSMADLRDAVFAFTDPMSFTGRTYPTFLVQQLGDQPESFFRRTFFSYSHDKAIYAVAAGVADAAAVDSLVLDHVLRRDPDMADRIQVIHRSPPFAIPPVVVPPDLPVRQKAQLEEIFLAMDQDQAGRAVLDDLGIDRFVPLEDTAYDEVRALVQQTKRTPWAP
jgi:phosphonate transport system substrate-binding protein